MKFKEIANRITGISFPIFGISWNPQTLEVDVARKVITYLEDRRVLYNPYELESPNYCIQSILQIREFLTEQLFGIKNDSELGATIRAMRAACRKFLDTTESQYYFDKSSRQIRDLGMGGQIRFYNDMGELRAIMGVLITKILIMHGIDCESDLLKILPIGYLEENE